RHADHRRLPQQRRQRPDHQRLRSRPAPDRPFDQEGVLTGPLRSPPIRITSRRRAHARRPFSTPSKRVAEPPGDRVERTAVTASGGMPMSEITYVTAWRRDDPKLAEDVKGFWSEL